MQPMPHLGMITALLPMAQSFLPLVGQVLWHLVPLFGPVGSMPYGMDSHTFSVKVADQHLLNQKFKVYKLCLHYLSD